MRHNESFSTLVMTCGKGLSGSERGQTMAYCNMNQSHRTIPIALQKGKAKILPQQLNVLEGNNVAATRKRYGHKTRLLYGDNAVKASAPTRLNFFSSLKSALYHRAASPRHTTIYLQIS